MKKSLLFFLFTTSFATKIIAQNVYVSGSSGGGAVNTSFTTLKAAFTAINSQSTQAGNNITITLTSSITETDSAVLNQPSVSNWNSLVIYPTVAGVTISGNVAGPLIKLYSADNVTIDGRVNRAGSANLTLVNSSTSETNLSGATRTSTIRIDSDAVKNAIIYCNIQGSQTSLSSGVIFFAGATSTSTGCDSNTVSNNNITGSSSGRPTCLLYSIGFSSQSRDNSNNNITNNNFYNFLNPSISSKGIIIGSSNLEWIISGNSFFETTTFNTTSSASYEIISVSLGSSDNILIENNYIGGNSPSASGTWLKTGNNNSFIGISYGSFSVFAGTIKNNSIRNFNWTNNGSSTFTGIHLTSGLATISNNTIGATTGIGSIIFTSGASGSNLYGILNSSTSLNAAIISNNSIGSLTTATSSSTDAANIIGICKTASGSCTINNNIIGSATTSYSIHANSTSTANNQSVIGINIISGGAILLVENTVANLTNASSNASFNSGVVTGIYYSGPTSGTNLVTRNFIRDLSLPGSSSGTLNGINIVAGATTYSNNIISIGTNSTNTIYGIYETGSTGHNNNLYFNTCYISGIPTTGALNSYAFYSTSTSNAKNIRNNIFYNARSNSGATGKHYGAYFNYSNYSSLTLNYNNYYAPGIGGYLGRENATDRTALPIMASSPTQDVSSTIIDPLFTVAGGNNATDYYASATLNGVNGTGVTGDYSSNMRATIPKMGAFEINTIVNSVSVYQNVTLLGSYPNLKLAFDNINNGSLSGDLIIKITASHILPSTAILYQNGANPVGTANYSSIHIYPTVSGISISGTLGTSLITLNGADNVIIDGRVNASGTAQDLVISNTRCVVEFINNASSNIIKYTLLKGSDNSFTSGIILFSGSNSGTGNNYNIIDNNNFTSDVYGRPANGIYSYGTTGFENSNITISNNNFYDLYNGALSTISAITVALNSTNWTIDNNSIYETSTVTQTLSQTYNAIYINVLATGKEFTITNNFIGGNAPICSGTWVQGGSVTNTFRAINVKVYGIGTCNINTNTIKNLSISSKGGAVTNEAFFGLYLDQLLNSTAGAAYMVDGNIIGASTGTGSITLTATNTSSTSYGIYTRSGNTGPSLTMQNNSVGSITTVGTATSVAHNFTAIYKSNGGVSSIINNIIGSTTTANSINTSSLANTSSGGQSLHGFNTSINVKSTFTLDNNTIANLNNNYTGTNAGLTIGISVQNNTTILITNNTITNLSTASAYSGDSSVASCIGIMQIHPFNSGGSITITGNTIKNLSNTAITEAVAVIGIFQGRSSTTSTIARNFIHSLSVASLSSSAAIKGIVIGHSFSPTTASIYNNIINLNVSSISPVIYGIQDISTVSSNHLNIYFNTIYLSGTALSGLGNSAAFWSNNNSSTRNIKNNIFYNARTNLGGLGKHYAIGLNGTAGTLSINNNNYYVTGIGGIVGFLTTDRISLSSWLSATSQDLNSTYSNPNLVWVGSNTATDYKPTMMPLYTGAIVASISLDFGLQPRGTFPVTMGAWEFFINKWIGTTNTAFNLTTNWTGGTLPDSGDVLVLDAATVSHCLLDTSRVIGTIYNSTSFNIVTNSYSLTLQDSIIQTGTGKINGSNGTVNFSGTKPLYIPLGTFTSNSVSRLTINNASGVTLMGDISVDTLLTLTSGIFTVGANTLTLNGANTAGTNTNMITTSGSSLVFGGNSEGVMVPPISVVNNLTLNNSNGIILEHDLTLHGNLTLTNGLFNPDTYNLTLAASGTTSGASNNSYVNGRIYKIGNTSFTFPIGANDGSGNKYRPCSISAPGLITDQFSAEYKWVNPNTAGYDTSSASRPTGVERVSSREFWNIERETGTSAVDVTLSFNDSSYVNNLSKLKVLHWNGISWDDLSGSATGTITNGNIVATGVSSFSPFTFGSSGPNPNPIPVKLIFFTANASGNDAILNWSTASEMNNDRFDIERSIDGINFETIGTEQGFGNSLTIQKYSYLDKNIGLNLNSNFYYRLKQIDLDGKFEYTNIVNVSFEKPAKAILQSIYPNPFENDISVKFQIGMPGDVIFSLVDITGRVILRNEVACMKGLNSISFDSEILKSGIYFLNIQFNGLSETHRMVKR